MTGVELEGLKKAVVPRRLVIVGTTITVNATLAPPAFFRQKRGIMK
jgi:hypothetical protein